MPKTNKPTRRGAVLNGLLAKAGIGTRSRPGRPYMNQRELLVLSSYIDILTNRVRQLEESLERATANAPKD